MEWLQSNWVWIALGIGFVALHWFGHGGHGHGGHGRYGRRDRDRANEAPGASAEHEHASTTATSAANSNCPARRMTPVTGPRRSLPRAGDTDTVADRQ